MAYAEKQPTVRVALAGMGVVGRSIAQALDSGAIPGTELTAVAVRDRSKADEFLGKLGRPPRVVALKELADHADIVIECAPSSLLSEIAEPVLKQGKKVVVLSVGALLGHPELEALARQHGGKIMVPTGALLGLDAVSAAAEGKIQSVRMVTNKPPAGLKGAPHLEKNGTSLEQLSEPVMVFKGTAREAATGFPANLNVAVALSLAGVGPDDTHLEIWANPNVTRNTHRIEVESDSARLTMTIENIPSDNPKTGLITARSVIALLRKMSASVQVGT